MNIKNHLYAMKMTVAIWSFAFCIVAGFAYVTFLYPFVPLVGLLLVVVVFSYRVFLNEGKSK